MRAGADPAVAAEAAGVDADLFARWLKIGEGRRAPRAYRDLVGAIRTAAARARVAAELAVHADDPKIWLTRGPGKERPHSPGWSAVVKPLVTVDNRTVNLLADSTAAAMIEVMLAALAAHPEARKDVLAALNGEAPRRKPPKLVDAAGDDPRSAASQA